MEEVRVVIVVVTGAAIAIAMREELPKALVWLMAVFMTKRH